MIFAAYASPIPGRAFKSASLAEFKSTFSADIADLSFDIESEVAVFAEVSVVFFFDVAVCAKLSDASMSSASNRLRFLFIVISPPWGTREYYRKVEKEDNRRSDNLRRFLGRLFRAFPRSLGACGDGFVTVFYTVILVTITHRAQRFVIETGTAAALTQFF